jgi:hypothetical protein
MAGSYVDGSEFGLRTAVMPFSRLKPGCGFSVSQLVMSCWSAPKYM